MEGQGRSFSITGLTFQVRKVIGGWGGGWVACRIILSAPVTFPFLWTLDFEFWIWDLNLGLGFGTGLGLDNFADFGISKSCLICYLIIAAKVVKFRFKMGIGTHCELRVIL